MVFWYYHVGQWHPREIDELKWSLELYQSIAWSFHMHCRVGSSQVLSELRILGDQGGYRWKSRLPVRYRQFRKLQRGGVQKDIRYNWSVHLCKVTIPVQEWGLEKEVQNL